MISLPEPLLPILVVNVNVSVILALEVLLESMQMADLLLVLLGTILAK